jgi:hypothetical protein
MAHGPLTPAELAEVERLLAELRAEPGRRDVTGRARQPAAS